MKKIKILLIIAIFLSFSMIAQAEIVINEPIFNENEQILTFTNLDSLTLKDFDINSEDILSDNTTNKSEKEIDISKVLKELNRIDNKTNKDNNLNKSNEEEESNIVSTYDADRYEPNNNYEEAFPYANTIKEKDHPFTKDYVFAGIHDEYDNDYFSIYLQSGKDYFFHLKNLTQDYDMILVNPSKTDFWHNAKYGTEEEYFYFNPSVSGTYYIVILGNGLPSPSHYLLYAGEAIRTDTLSESTDLSFTLYSGETISNYQYYSTIGKIPADAVLNTVRIDSNGTGYWTGLSKYLRAESGHTYHNQLRTGLDSINYPNNTQYAAQNWRIAGSIVSGGPFSWKPRITMEYIYVMTP